MQARAQDIFYMLSEGTRRRNHNDKDKNETASVLKKSVLIGLTLRFTCAHVAFRFHTAQGEFKPISYPYFTLFDVGRGRSRLEITCKRKKRKEKY